MLRLIKMEWYKLRTSKSFLILLAVLFAINAALAAIVPMVLRAVTQMTEIEGVEIEGEALIPDTINLSEVIASPFMMGMLLIIVFVSVVSFLYTDIENGYVKNIAGQLKNRGVLVNAKFVVIAIHNLMFFAVAVLSNLLGSAIGYKIIVDDAIAQGILTVLLKWVLSVALSCILMMITTGFRNKTFGTVMGVFFATGLLSLIYMGFNTAASKLIRYYDMDISDFMPDALMPVVDVINNEYVLNGIVVGAVCIILFLTLTYIIFRKRDVK